MPFASTPASLLRRQQAEAVEFRELCARLGWAGREVSQRLEVTTQTVAHWRQGVTKPPASVLHYLRLLVEVRDFAERLLGHTREPVARGKAGRPRKKEQADA